MVGSVTFISFLAGADAEKDNQLFPQDLYSFIYF